MQLLAPLTAPTARSRGSSSAAGPASSRSRTPSTTSRRSAPSCAVAGLRLLYDEPRPGTLGTLVNFVHPKDAGGVLVELVEHRREMSGASIARARERVVKKILDAILAGDTDPAVYAALAVPESYTAVTVHQDEQEMFAGMASRDKDPRRSLHVEEVPTPELGPGEALVAVMASAINYNTVWTSIFEPVSTFGFLERYGRTSPLAKRHDLPYHVVGSDLSGVVLRTGPGVHTWQPGDEVVAHCLSVELESPLGHNDTMLDPEQRIWGFETNFGGLAQLALVKSNQLLHKPAHLTWEEAAVPGLVNSTAYRQLVSRNGAGMKQGDIVLIWGASGGLGSYATQLALGGGATPVCVVSSEEKAEIVRTLGAELIIDRSAEDLPVLEGRAHPGPEGVAAARQAHPRAHRRRRRRHRLRAPRPRDVRRVGLRRAQGRHDRHLRVDERLPARVRQPLPVDEPQAHRRLALRQLPRGLGGQPADPARPDPPDAVAARTRWPRPGRPRTTSTATCTRARSASWPWRREPGLGRARPRAARAAPRRDQPLPRRLTLRCQVTDRPPSTTSSWPVMNATRRWPGTPPAPVISSASPSGPSAPGRAAPRRSLGSSRANSVRSVATQPGTSALTRTPACAHSTASERVSDSTAAFAAP